MNKVDDLNHCRETEVHLLEFEFRNDLPDSTYDLGPEGLDQDVCMEHDPCGAVAPDNFFVGHECGTEAVALTVDETLLG